MTESRITKPRIKALNQEQTYTIYKFAQGAFMDVDYFI